MFRSNLGYSDILGDTPLIIRKENPMIIHAKSYEWMSQCVYIGGPKTGMFNNNTINSVTGITSRSLQFAQRIC